MSETLGKLKFLTPIALIPDYGSSLVAVSKQILQLLSNIWQVSKFKQNNKFNKAQSKNELLSSARKRKKKKQTEAGFPEFLIGWKIKQ